MTTILWKNTTNSSRRKGLLIIQGDWNAKVGPDANEQRSGSVGDEKDFKISHTDTKMDLQKNNVAFA